jgi:superfamily II DNA or RNA helicase
MASRPHLTLVSPHPPDSGLRLHQGALLPVTYCEPVSLSVPSSDRTAQLRAVLALPLPQLVVLEMVALHGQTLSLRRLIEIGRALTAGDEFAPTRVGPLVNSLLEQGLLREVEGHLLVGLDPGLTESLCLACMRAGRATLVVDQILSFEPWGSRMLSSPSALWRYFRLHLYGGLGEQAGRMAANLERHGRNAWSELGQLLSSPEELLAFPPRVALQLARETVIASLNRAFPAPHAMAVLGQLASEATPREQQLYAHALMMMGRDEELDRFLEQHDFPTLEGCRKVLQGDLGGLDDFERGLRDANFFPSYTALFLYLVALLAGPGLDSPRAQEVVSRYQAFRVPFEWLLSVKAGRAHGITPEMQQQIKEAPDSLIPHYSLLCYWAGCPVEGVDAAERARMYRAAGYQVFADWLGHAVQEVPEDAPRPPLLSVLHPETTWRKVLDALRSWAGSAPRALEIGERLVWHIEPFVVRREVDARLQKRGKSGAWSSGRRLDLEDLCANPPACADEHDQKVLNALLRLTRANSRYGYVSRADQHNVALLALTGHPRVYHSKHPEQPVELTLQPVAVVLRRLAGQLELQLEPCYPHMPHVLAEPAGPGKIHLFHITERLVQLSRLLQGGLKLPLEAEAELGPTLSELTGAGLTLRSDIQLGGLLPEGQAEEPLLLRLSPYGDGLAVQVRVAPLGPDGPSLPPGQGSPVIAGPDRDSLSGRQVRRDLEAEERRFQQLRELHPRVIDSDFILPTAMECLTFLEGFAEAKEPWYRLEWPEGERFSVSRRLHLSQLRQRVRGSGEWFSVGAEVEVEEGLVYTLGELLEARRLAAGRFVPLEGGRFVALTEEVERHLERLDRLAQRQARGEVQLHPLNALLALEGQQLEADRSWSKLSELFHSSQRLEPAIPATLQARLRDYQAEGVRWLLRLAHWGVGACLADDMGLGKTVQLLAVLLDRAALGPSLVVAPTSVCWNWVVEAARFAPTLRVHSLDPTKLSALGPEDVVVTSYGLLVNHSQALQEVSWSTVVLDEAQAIKNALTQRARAAQGLKAGFRVAATGTPVENHPDELWSLFRYLNPGLLGSRRGFNQRFGSPGGLQELARQVRPFVLRRSKSQVLHELPARTEIVERVVLSEPERALYESLRREAVRSLQDDPDGSYLSVLGHLSRLRLACCHPRLVLPESKLSSAKLERCLELVEELRENGHRALLFSQFVSHLQIVREALEQRGISYAYLDGSTPPAGRRKAVESFQGGQGDVFLISLKAGGSGLNLTASDYVLHLDPWWNPAVEDQATDRAHRMGQQRPVTVYRLVAEDTIEEQMVSLHEEKRELAERLLEGTENSHRLSTAELLDLLGQRD